MTERTETPEEFIEKMAVGKHRNLNFYSFFKDSNFVAENLEMEPDRVLTIEEALQAVELARKQGEEKHNDNCCCEDHLSDGYADGKDETAKAIFEEIEKAQVIAFQKLPEKRYKKIKAKWVKT